LTCTFVASMSSSKVTFFLGSAAFMGLEGTVSERLERISPGVSKAPSTQCARTAATKLSPPLKYASAWSDKEILIYTGNASPFGRGADRANGHHSSSNGALHDHAIHRCHVHHLNWNLVLLDVSSLILILWTTSYQ
jgi:hypothetical protein